MKTRAQAQLDELPETDPAELQALQALFERAPAVRRRPIAKKRPPRRHNKKVDDYDMERIRIMRDEQRYTYEAIGRKLNMRAQTVYMALRRFKSRQNEHVDNRKNNGRHTPRKITGAI